MSSWTLREGSCGPYSRRPVKDRVARADVVGVADLTTSAVRCGRCSASVRPGAPWCTQCYASPAAPPTTATAAGVERPGPAGSSGSPAACWPCSACGEPNAFAEQACTACGTRFLAPVRYAPPAVVLPVVGDLLALSPVRRSGLAVAVVAALVVVAALLGLLLA